MNLYSSYSTQLREINFMARVYGWMSVALAITATSAYWVSQTAAIFGFISQNPAALLVLVLVQLGLVLGISGFLHRLSFPAALVMFGVYSLTMGLTLSVIFMVYTMQSIMSTFIVTAGMFAGMALYGYFTKTDLTSLGNMLFMALLGLILAGLVNMFLHSEKFDIVLSGVGVIIFTLLVAVDAQRIKYLGQEMMADRDTINKAALLGSLALYLDFVNLFLYLLRFMGKKQES